MIKIPGHVLSKTPLMQLNLQCKLLVFGVLDLLCVKWVRWTSLIILLNAIWRLGGHWMSWRAPPTDLGLTHFQKKWGKIWGMVPSPLEKLPTAPLQNFCQKINGTPKCEKSTSCIFYQIKADQDDLMDMDPF